MEVNSYIITLFLHVLIDFYCQYIHITGLRKIDRLVPSFFTVQIPDIAVSEDGKVFLPDTNKGEGAPKLTNVQGRKLKLGRIPVALTCAIHSKYILPDPTLEEESILNTTLTIISDFDGELISFYKPGGEILATTSTIQVCNFLSIHPSLPYSFTLGNLALCALTS